LVIGLDDQYDFSYIKSLRECVQRLGIATEIVSVYSACTVFNFVNEEGRYVIAALIPRKAPKPPLKLPQSESEEQMTDSNNTTNNKMDSAKTKSITK